MKKVLVLSALVLGLVSCEKDEVPTNDCGCDKIVGVIESATPKFYFVKNECEDSPRKITYTTPTPQKEGECYKAK